MNRLQWFLSVLLISALFMGIRADSGSDSESGSGSDESNESGGKRHRKQKHPAPQQYPYPNYHYNQPVYMPQPPPPYGGTYYPPPPPMPYYYGYQPQQQPPPVPYGNPYPYGGYYNQGPPPQLPGAVAPPTAPGQGPVLPQGPQVGYPGIPGGSSTINHSLKVNKEYQEDGHHYRPDGTSTD